MAADGTDEYKSVLEYLRKEPALLSSLAFLVSIGSFCLSLWSAGSSAKSADASVTQLRLASRPALYARCKPTPNDRIKLTPHINTVLFAIRPDEAMSVGGFSRPPDATFNFEAEYPSLVTICTMTNVGKGAAINVNFTVRTVFIHDPKNTGNGIAQGAGIEYLAAGEDYVILIANRTQIDAIMMMPATANFDVAVTGEHIVGDRIIRGEGWVENEVNNKLRPDAMTPAK